MTRTGLAVAMASPAGAAIAALFAVACRAWVVRRSSARVVPEPSGRADLVTGHRESPSADAVGVVLGAGLRADGSPTGLLARRVEAGVALFDRGLIDLLIMSGAADSEVRDQPAAMAQLAVALGVPAERIELDRLGVDTAATCRQLRARDDVRTGAIVVLVTQEFHIHRAVYLAAKAGLEVVGCPSPDAEVRPAALARARVREIPAAVKAMFLDRF